MAIPACIEANLASVQLWDGYLRYFVRGFDLFEILDDLLDRAIDLVQRSVRADLELPSKLGYFVAFQRCFETLDLADSEVGELA